MLDTETKRRIGTAGFLISAWKHILAANMSTASTSSHSTLTPDERGRLAKNFKGYDISPDMVRLSLVNLYLHGFADESILPRLLSGPVTYIGLENIVQNTGKITENLTTENPATVKSLKNVFQPGDILYGKLRPNLNKVWFANQNGICSTDIFVIRPKSGNIESLLYAHLFRSKHFNLFG